MSARNELRFILLQARRASDPVREEERDSFAAQLGVEPHQVHGLDIFNDSLDLQRVLDHDALLVGGAGEYGVLDPEPRIAELVRFLVQATERGHPTFASCFGFQALVIGLGGTVVHDEAHAEVGTYRLRRLEPAVSDSLFSSLPSEFNAQLGHKDRAETIPQGVDVMAESDLCPYQAMRVTGTPVFATQFHPELTGSDNRTRFSRYMAQYGKLFGEEEAQRKLESHQPSPEANGLLARFVDTILLEGP